MTITKIAEEYAVEDKDESYIARVILDEGKIFDVEVTDEIGDDLSTYKTHQIGKAIIAYRGKNE